VYASVVLLVEPTMALLVMKEPPKWTDHRCLCFCDES
jgi:hypothetical protein